jgi:hypothetical protein
MLTQEDWNERMWGEYPTLRILLQDKQIPGYYTGLTSVSDNIFDKTQRLLKISILVKEYVNVKEQKKEVDQQKLLDDLIRLVENLESFYKYISSQKEEIRNIRDILKESHQASL